MLAYKCSPITSQRLENNLQSTSQTTVAHNVSSGSPPLANEIIVGYDEPARDTQYVCRWSSPAHSDTNDRTPCACTCFFAIVPATLPPTKTSSEISDPNHGSSIPRQNSGTRNDFSFDRHLPLKKCRHFQLLFDSVDIFHEPFRRFFINVCVNRVHGLKFLFSEPLHRVLLYAQFTVPIFNTTLDSLSFLIVRNRKKKRSPQY